MRRDFTPLAFCGQSGIAPKMRWLQLCGQSMASWQKHAHMFLLRRAEQHGSERFAFVSS